MPRFCCRTRVSVKVSVIGARGVRCFRFLAHFLVDVTESDFFHIWLEGQPWCGSYVCFAVSCAMATRSLTGTY